MLALTNSGVGNNKSEFAKETAKRIINQLHDQDNIAVTYFGVEFHVYIPLTPKSEIPKEKIEKMKKGIKCKGSTYYYNAIEGAYKQLEQSTSKNKRIILISDGGNELEEFKYNQYFESINKEHNIELTFILIEHQNVKLTNSLCYNRGCSYFCFSKKEDIEKYIDNHLNYMLFPHSYDYDVVYTSTNSKIYKCIGVGKAEIDSKKTKEGMKTRSLMNTKSSFPSDLIVRKGEYYSKGGLILLKVEKDEESKDELISFQITVKYTDREGKKCIQNYDYSFRCNEENNFSSDAIRNGIALYYYGQGYRKIAKLAESIRNLEKVEYQLTYEKEVSESNINKIIEEENKQQKEITKCEEIIKNLVEITSYDNVWNDGTFLKENYKEIEGLTENKRGEYLKNMMAIYEPSIKTLQRRKEDNDF